MRNSEERDASAGNRKRNRQIGSDLTAVLENRSRWLAAATRLVGDRESAKDVLQEASVRALIASGTLRDRERLVPWFRSVLANAAVDHSRRDGAYRRALAQLAVEISSPRTDREPDAIDCTCVQEALSSLTPRYAGILRMIDVEGSSLDEVATTNGITKTNARVRLHRARRALRSRVLLVCGGVPSDQCLPCACQEQSACKGARRPERTVQPAMSGRRKQASQSVG
jgi:RNA polymerase sigma-70 factor (ECF subfamily)